MRRVEIEKEMQRRAAACLPRTHLIADYYRVRRKVAYPLPVRKLHLLRMPMAGHQGYPWATWMTWALEERIGCLGWAAAWFGDEAAREAAAKDLAALAAWPVYRQYEKPDLSLGHAARILWTAYARWTWLDAGLRENIEAAFRRLLDDVMPLSDELHGVFQCKEDILALSEPHRVLHNIPIIGTVGAALAAHALGHEKAGRLNERLHALLGAWLEARREGFSEGAAYDGYVMDFAASWLESLPEAQRAPVLGHPRFEDLLEESYRLAAPGTAEQLAELSDVEPERMPFHLSAQAKFQRFKPSATRAWHLRRCRVSWLRVEALAALRPLAEALRGEAPPAGALDAHYAAVLRSGWERDDLAVAVASSNSPMGHIHHDNGSLVIGTRGRWLITDPGYQQYLKKTERLFTLGPTAHNAPLINGQAQANKAAQRLALDAPGKGLYRTVLDLTRCYAPELPLAGVRRTVWLADAKQVIVADRVRGKGAGAGAVDEITYHWHGHAEAAWWVREGWARLYVPEATLWIHSPQAKIGEENVDRLPGSRGQLTLTASADPRAPFIWWVFALGTAPPEIQAGPEAGTLRVGTEMFHAAD